MESKAQKKEREMLSQLSHFYISHTEKKADKELAGLVV